jgi:hypothetical protein
VSLVFEPQLDFFSAFLCASACPVKVRQHHFTGARDKKNQSHARSSAWADSLEPQRKLDRINKMVVLYVLEHKNPVDPVNLVGMCLFPFLAYQLMNSFLDNSSGCQ